MKDLISIIIPTFNRADLIGETLDSVLVQTYSSWECIIIDDGSTDNSITVIQKYLDLDSRFLYLYRPNYKKKGPSACRNFGIEKSQGEFIIFLDSDDLLSNDCLQNRISFANKNPDFDLWIFKMQTFGDQLAPNFKYGFLDSTNPTSYCVKQFSLGYHPFIVTCPIWKKSVLIANKGFNENLTMFEDPEMHLRILKNNGKAKFANFDSADCFYRLNELNDKRNFSKEVANHFVFFKIHLKENAENEILYFKRVLNELILKRLFLATYFKYCILGIQKNIISFKNLFFGLIVMMYHLTNLFKFNQLGYHFFKKQFNNF